METEKAFHYSITLLGGFSLKESEAKYLLDKEDYEKIDDKDWDTAAERYVQTFIDQNDIPQVNDVEIEEVWHN